MSHLSKGWSICQKVGPFVKRVVHLSKGAVHLSKGWSICQRVCPNAHFLYYSCCYRYWCLQNVYFVDSKTQKILQIEKELLSRGATGWMPHVRNTNNCLLNNMYQRTCC